MNSTKHRIGIASKTVTRQYGSSTVLQQVNVGRRYMHHLLIQQLYVISATAWKETQRNKLGIRVPVKLNLSGNQDTGAFNFWRPMTPRY